MLETFEGIVLFRKQYREEDSIVKIISPEFGKRMFFIKKGQLVNNRFHSQLLPFSINHYTGTINSSGFSFIRESETIVFHKKIAQDLTLQAYASYFVQLVDAAFEDFEPNIEIYFFLKQSILKLNEGFNCEIVLIYFELNILRFFGITFDFSGCQICGKTQGIFDVSIQFGGVVCKEHFECDRYRLHLSPRSVYLAQLLTSIPLEKINSMNIKSETLNELKRMTNELLNEYVGIKLKSRQFIEELATIESKYQELLAVRQKK